MTHTYFKVTCTDIFREVLEVSKLFPLRNGEFMPALNENSEKYPFSRCIIAVGSHFTFT